MYDSSQTDTFHVRPRGLAGQSTVGIAPANKRGGQDGTSKSGTAGGDSQDRRGTPSKNHGRHQATQSVVFGAAGEIFDEPKKAVYGIKKAKNVF